MSKKENGGFMIDLGRDISAFGKTAIKLKKVLKFIIGPCQEC